MTFLLAGLVCLFGGHRTGLHTQGSADDWSETCNLLSLRKTCQGWDGRMWPMGGGWLLIRYGQDGSDLLLALLLACQTTGTQPTHLSQPETQPAHRQTKASLTALSLALWDFYDNRNYILLYSDFKIHILSELSHCVCRMQVLVTTGAINNYLLFYSHYRRTKDV